MADQPPNSDTGVRPTEDRPPGIPRWLKISGIIVLVLVLLVVVVLVTGLGGEHGPGQFGPGGHGPRGATPSIEQEEQQP